MATQKFIIVMRDVGYKLIGPFASDAHCRGWVHTHWDPATGDPRWQTLEIDGDPNARPEVLHPGTIQAANAI